VKEQQEQHNLIFNWPGNIVRLPLHVGAAMAWYDLKLPRPDEIIASSAGAIAGSAIIGWDKKSLDEASRIIGELSPDDIFSYRRELKVKLGLLGITTVGLVGTALVMFGWNLSKKEKAEFGLAGLVALFGAGATVGKELLHSESQLSAAPLKNLLSRKLDFPAIFKSKIRLSVIVADIAKPGEVIFHNHDPLNNSERWVKILLASARVPGHFPFVQIDELNTVDGEVWTDFPIRQMRQYNKIVRFDYWPPLLPEPSPKEWIPDLFRSFDIMRGHCTQTKMRCYEIERQHDPSLPGIFYIRLNQRLLDAMPKFQLHNFTPDNMVTMQNIGYAAITEQENEIRRYLEKTS